jgi:hypothetical protein
MKSLGQFCRKYLAASVLVLAFACSTFAGDMQYPGITSTPPATTNGDISFPGVVSSTDTVDGEIQYPGVTVVAMSLLESALALF